MSDTNNTNNNRFVHLHNHSSFSLLDGAESPLEMSERACELGMESLALTDHGRMGGLAEFFVECKKRGVKPLLGMEAYCVGMGRSRKDRTNYNSLTRDLAGSPGYEKTNYHLILLAKDKQGWESLSKLSAESYANGFYYKPRIDYGLLEKYHDGLIVSSACIIGEVSNNLLNNDYDKARKVASWFQQVFGEDYYLEVMNHGLDIEQKVMRPLRDLADELGIKTIVTNDCHYAKKEDHKIQKTLMLLNMHKSWADSDVKGSFFDDDNNINENNRQSGVVDNDAGGDEDPIFETPAELYIKTYEEMVAANRINGGEDGRVERELATTLEIADKCSFELPIIDPDDVNAYYLPSYDIKTDVKYDEYVEEDKQGIVPDYIEKAVIDSHNKENNTSCSKLEDFMSESEIQALSFLAWLCDKNMDRLIRPKIMAKGEPLSVDYWSKNLPSDFTINHAHNSPDEIWIKRKISEGLTTDDIMDLYKKRLAYEFSIVVPKKFVNYFLIVQSYVGYTRANKASIGPGRGSGAGSLLNYLSGITSVDPLPSDLMFERFISPERRGFPDIDLDFSAQWRDNHLWKHLRDIYGYENTAQVAAYQFFWGKAAIRAAARVLYDTSRDKNISSFERREGKEISVTYANNLADLIDNKPKLDLNTELKDDVNPALMQLIRSDKKYQDIIKLALILQGRISGESQHASAYIISPHDITSHLPLMTSKDERAKSQTTGEAVNEYIIQYDGRAIQDLLGYVKLDLLCINDLEVVERTLKTIKETYGCEIDIENIPLDDKLVFDMVKKGHNAGIFQFDGSPVAGRLLKESKADCIEDWSAISALNRPGPLQMGYDKQFVEGKLHPETIKYFTNNAEQYLKDTYGVCIFQETLMLMSQDKNIIGFTGGQADNMRKILAHKDKKKIQGIVDLAHETAKKNNVPENIVNEFCDIAVAAGSYSFNHSHALSYALIGYRGAFLKAHFPECFLAAMCQLKPKMKDKDKIPDYLTEALQLKVKIKPPHVNISETDFSVPEKNTIAYGLNRIKGVGNAATIIVNERKQNGTYKDITDFCCRVPKTVTKTALLPLIKAGALDNLGWTRKALIENIDYLIDFRKKWQTMQKQRQNLDTTTLNNQDGTLQLFGEPTTTPTQTNNTPNTTIELIPPHDNEYTPKELLAQEKTNLGIYLSGSPEDYTQLTKYKHEKLLKQKENQRYQTKRKGQTIPDYDDYEPINISELTKYEQKIQEQIRTTNTNKPPQPKLELLATVKPTGKNNTPYYPFKNNKGARLTITDWGILEQSRYGYQPTRYEYSLTIFSTLWQQLSHKPKPEELLHIKGKLNIDATGKYPPSLICDQLEYLTEDTTTFQNNPQEATQLQTELNDLKQALQDPQNKIYQTPQITFTTEKEKNKFLNDPNINQYKDTHSRIILTTQTNPNNPIIVNLKSYMSLINYTQNNYQATITKTLPPPELIN